METIDFNNDQEKLLVFVLNECGKDFAIRNKKTPRENSVYDWIDITAKDVIAIDIVNKLNSLGYKITKIESSKDGQ